MKCVLGQRGGICTVMWVVFLVSLSSATTVDLTMMDSQGVINNAVFLQINPNGSAGTGVFDAFLGIQKKDVESGYNTDGALEFNTQGGSGTHSLLLSNVPVLNYKGTEYREFCLDLNQNVPTPLISLDELKIHLASTGDLTGYETNPAFGAAIYDLDANGDSWVKMDYSLNSGSGQADVSVLIPSALFGTDENQYVYLYSKFGEHFSTNDGFEEWGVGVGGTIVPEPVTLVVLGLGTLLMRRRK